MGVPTFSLSFIVLAYIAYFWRLVDARPLSADQLEGEHAQDLY
jgi:hypothetical protein